MSDDFASKENDYLALLKSIIIVGEANKGKQVDNETLYDSENLLRKFVLHASTILQIYRGTSIKELNIAYYDFPSLYILARAAFESLLTFHYIFIEPVTIEEQRFRHLVWRYCGIKRRNDFPVFSNESREKMLKEGELLKVLKDLILTNNIYIKLDPDSQKKIMQGYWRLNSWSNIALSMGMDELHAKYFYRFLCGFAHSDYITIIQIHDASNKIAQRSMMLSSMNILMMCMAFMIKSYFKLFPDLTTSLNDDLTNIVDFWYAVGTKPLKDINLDSK